MNVPMSSLTNNKPACVCGRDVGVVLIMYCFPRGSGSKSPYLMLDTLLFD